MLSKGGIYLVIEELKTNDDRKRVKVRELKEVR
jgi:hypothetical protein